MTFRKCDDCGEDTLAGYYSSNGAPPNPAMFCACHRANAEAGIVSITTPWMSAAEMEAADARREDEES